MRANYDNTDEVTSSSDCFSVSLAAVLKSTNTLRIWLDTLPPIKISIMNARLLKRHMAIHLDSKR